MSIIRKGSRISQIRSFLRAFLFEGIVFLLCRTGGWKGEIIKRDKIFGPQLFSPSFPWVRALDDPTDSVDIGGTVISMREVFR